MNWKKLLVGKWSWKRPFYTVFWCYLLLALFACTLSDRLIFQPPGTPYSDVRTHFGSIEMGEEKVAIYHRPAISGMPTLLWSHGNAQNLSSVRPALDSLNGVGFGVISYDYPGYGESSGKPNEKGSYEAIEATYQYLTQTKNVPAEKIILVGQSVGSGPTCWLAAREDHHAVVLISPFLSAFRTVTRIPIFPGDRFPNVKWIQEFETPLLIIHGKNDQVISFDHGKKLYELSKSPDKTLFPVPDAGHNDLFIRGEFDLGALILQLGKKKE